MSLINLMLSIYLSSWNVYFAFIDKSEKLCMHIWLLQWKEKIYRKLKNISCIGIQEVF